LKENLGDLKEIMGDAGLACQDMLLTVDVNVVGDWLLDLDESRRVVVCGKIAGSRVNRAVGNTVVDDEDCTLPAISAKTTSRRKLLEHYGLSTLSISPTRIGVAVSDDTVMMPRRKEDEELTYVPRLG